MGCCSSTPIIEDTPPMSQIPPPKPVDPDSPFVVRSGAHLYYKGQPFRFSSFNAPELLDGDVNQEFEWRDTFKTFGAHGGFGTRVTRSYCFRINSKNIHHGHIKAWNSEWNDWEWSGERLEELDKVLALAAENDVKLIIPFINQDFGSEDTNWVGNTTDLVRLRKGISSYESAKNVDFWRDEEMINSVKLIIDKILTRTNSVNGRVYKDDPTILAWETGNELSEHGYRPAPASWTLKIARHIKHHAPNTLVMDGSFAKTDSVEARYLPEVLASDDIDIMSYHFYGDGEGMGVARDLSVVRKYAKPFIAGEYGFFSDPSSYQQFLSTIISQGATGALIWSLRPHSHRGGFKTHGEGDGHWSYHVPGWSQPQHAEFDPREYEILRHIRSSSFAINNFQIPPAPVPEPSPALWIEKQEGRLMLHWQGSPWSAYYKLLLEGNDGYELIGQLEDCTKECHANTDVSQLLGRRVALVSVGMEGGESQPCEGLVVYDPES